jgi:hypothetical protein
MPDYIDYNHADPQVDFELIPQNTIAKARIILKPGHDPEDPYLTEARNGDSSYLNCEFVILDGPFEKRRIFEKIGVKGSAHWVNFGKARIRAILESARNIHPKDVSIAAVQARRISSHDRLDGLIVIIKIGIERDKRGFYPDKNRIVSIITPDSKDYRPTDDGMTI